jgi:hypothetical protein
MNEQTHQRSAQEGRRANEYADVNGCFAANVLLDIKINSMDGLA